MTKDRQILEINRTINMLMAHPDNEPNSEFADRIDSLIELKQQLAVSRVVDTLPADVLIKSLGEAKKPNEYILKTHNGVWWIEHKHVGSAEPLKQWLTDKPISE